MKKIFVMLSIILLLAGCSENNDVATANTTTQTSLESVEDTTVATLHFGRTVPRPAGE